MTAGAPDDGATETDEELDRHRRRVLWALPTGLYLVGSRAGDEVNLMTANLVVQVCMEPKLVGVALERDSVTARLVDRGRSFAISLLHRADRDVVRRFVKPVTEVERAPDGAVLAMSGHAVTEVGPDRVPALAAAAGYIACAVRSGRTSEATRWSSGRSPRSAGSRRRPRSCAWRTPACITAAEARAPSRTSGTAASPAAAGISPKRHPRPRAPRVGAGRCAG